MVQIIIQSLLITSLVLLLYVIVATLERGWGEKRYSFIYYVAAIIFYVLGYFIEISCGNLDGGIIATKIMYAGASFFPPLFFFFVADNCEVHFPKKYYRIPLLVVPALFYFLVLRFESHQLFYRVFDYDPFKTPMGLVFEPGPFYLVGVFYPLFCLSLSLIVLIRSLISHNRQPGLVLLLINSITLMACIALSFFNETALAEVNYTTFVLVIFGFIVYRAILRNDLFDLVQKAQLITVEMIRDAFVVLDRNMAYAASNKKAQELFPGLALYEKGKPIFELKNWPSELLIGNGGVFEAGPDSGENGIEFSLKHRPGKIYLGGKNRISAESGVTLGWVILIQDITETSNLSRDKSAQQDEIAAMRENLGEGVFVINREYRIQNSYSKVLKEILSVRNLNGRKFSDLLSASYDPKKMMAITGYLDLMMGKPDDAGKPENPLGLFRYISTETGKQKILSCHFVPLERADGEILLMGIIRDLSIEFSLKKKLRDINRHQ